MAETQDLRVAAQIGQNYVGLCDQFLTEQLGRQYTVPELAQFAETAAATLLASAYANFRDALGKEASELWLNKTLKAAAGAVRNMGADALVRFEVHIKDMPNSLHKQRQEMKAEPPAPASASMAGAAPPASGSPKCTCPLSPDGGCTPCLEIVAAVHRGTFVFMKQMKEASEKCQTICQVCAVGQTDRALATLLLEARATGMPDAEIVQVMHAIAMQCGVKDIPLTEKALKETVKA